MEQRDLTLNPKIAETCQSRAFRHQQHYAKDAWGGDSTPEIKWLNASENWLSHLDQPQGVPKKEPLIAQSFESKGLRQAKPLLERQLGRKPQLCTHTLRNESHPAHLHVSSSRTARVYCGQRVWKAELCKVEEPPSTTANVEQQTFLSVHAGGTHTHNSKVCAHREDKNGRIDTCVRLLPHLPCTFLHGEFARNSHRLPLPSPTSTYPSFKTC